MKYITDLEKRPLTESERLFSEENYDLFLWYVGFYKLNEEESDALVIPYLTVVKKYLSIPRLQQYKFSTILVRQLNRYRQLYYRRMYSKKYMPESGVCSLNSPINKDNKEEGEIGSFVIDKSINIERKVIDQEICKEFMHVIDKFSYADQMKIILYLRLEGYSEKEIIEYIQEKFADSKFDKSQLNFLLQQMRFAFKKAGLDSFFFKTSLCNVVYYDILEYAIKEKIIKRQGAKLLYNGEMIGKGRDEGKTYLEEHPAELSKIMDKLELKYLCAG